MDTKSVRSCGKCGMRHQDQDSAVSRDMVCVEGDARVTHGHGPESRVKVKTVTETSSWIQDIAPVSPLSPHLGTSSFTRSIPHQTLSSAKIILIDIDNQESALNIINNIFSYCH